MLDLSATEHQELVLMCGSRKEWAKYLGLDEKTASSIWTSLGLKTPTDWLRTLDRSEQLELLARHGSIDKLAKHLGMSSSAARSILTTRLADPPDWTEEQCLELFERYRSVTLIARLHGGTESWVRKQVDRLGLEIATLVDYSFGGNSNAKGRRAELQWAEMRGSLILADRNILDGSQADWDFDDAELGRVNVKSSQQYAYKARSRKDNRFFWKISTAGADKADHLVCMCYDDRMSNLVGYKVVPTDPAVLPSTRTFRLYQSDLTVIEAG